VVRKKCVGLHQIIHVEQSNIFEPIPRENFCDGNKVDVGLSHMRWSLLLRANLESNDVSSIGCRITCATPCDANLRNPNEYIFSIIKVKGASVGSGTHVATDRTSFMSLKTNNTSNVTQGG
jgi:hypothetical protein